MKRLFCFFLLLPAFVFSTYAVPKIDGIVKLAEYGEKNMHLFIQPNNKSNNVSAAYLCQYVSPEDYSVYIGARYVCEDVGVTLHSSEECETGEVSDAQTQIMTGIILWLNGEKCCTAYYDGTVEVTDRTEYDVDAAFKLYSDNVTDNPASRNFDGEVRLGVKRGIPYDTVLGIQILDCSGKPSSLYETIINPTPITPTTDAYIVRWIVDGVVMEQVVENGEAIVRPPDPVKDGYVFTGWMLTTPPTSTTNDMTYTAQFEKIKAVSMHIIHYPSRMLYTYKKDKCVDLSGIELEITYSDGTKNILTDLSSCVVSGFSSASHGNNTVTIEYDGIQTSFVVTVQYAWWQILIRVFLLGFLWY